MSLCIGGMHSAGLLGQYKNANGRADCFCDAARQAYGK